MIRRKNLNRQRYAGRVTKALIGILLGNTILQLFLVGTIPPADAAATSNGTTWFLRSTTAVAAFTTTGPVTEQSSATDLVPLSPATKSVALAMTDTPGSSQTSVAGTETSASAGQLWFRTFLSPKLGAQTISSGTVFRLETGLAENSLSANMTIRSHIFQWREGTGKIASLLDTVTTTDCGVEPGAASSERSEVCVTGATASAVTLNNNDQIALEIWVMANNTSATSFTGTLYFEGTGFIGNGATSHVVSSALSNLHISKTLTLAATTTKQTEWYLHATSNLTANGVTGPTAEQSAATDLVSGSPANKTTALSMDNQIGSSQTSVAGTETSASAGNIWLRTFMSPQLAAQTMPVGTTFRFEGGFAENNLSANMILRIHIYQWREGVGNIASIIDNVSATNCGAEPTAINTEQSQVCITAATGGTFTFAEFDQIALEVWMNANNTSTTSFTGTFYFDGTEDIENGAATHTISSSKSMLSISPGVTLSTSNGSLGVDIVDNGGSTVASPSVSFSSRSFSYSSQTGTGTFGIASEKIRASNTRAIVTWNLTVAATAGTTALWSAGSPKYDYNDLSGESDGTDADSYGGQLTINPSGSTVAAVSPCTSTTGLSKGSSSAFSEVAPIVSSITLVTASSSASTNCSWDITGISLSQAIPATQAAGTYGVSFTLTIL